MLTTNNDPNVVLLLYLLAVLKSSGMCILLISGYSITVHLCVLDNDYTGCPSIIRSDCGTENTIFGCCSNGIKTRT